MSAEGSAGSMLLGLLTLGCLGAAKMVNPTLLGVHALLNALKD